MVCGHRPSIIHHSGPLIFRESLIPSLPPSRRRFQVENRSFLRRTPCLNSVWNIPTGVVKPRSGWNRKTRLPIFTPPVISPSQAGGIYWEQNGSANECLSSRNKQILCTFFLLIS